MKLSLVALPFLLLALTTASPGEFSEEMGIHDKSILSGGLVGHDLTPPCCQKYSKGKFRKDRVKSYFITDSHCRLYSVVFVFKNELKGCADPNAQWVKDLMKYLDNKKNPTSSTPPAVPTPSA